MVKWYFFGGWRWRQGDGFLVAANCGGKQFPDHGGWTSPMISRVKNREESIVVLQEAREGG